MILVITLRNSLAYQTSSRNWVRLFLPHYCLPSTSPPVFRLLPLLPHRRGATSLEITVWSHQLEIPAGQQPVPDRKIFDKTLTDVGLVHEVQDQLDGKAIVTFGGGSCETATVVYLYQFHFATLGVPTQIYYGQTGCPGWDASVFDIPPILPVFHVAIQGVKLDGMFILVSLHDKIAMPILPT